VRTIDEYRDRYANAAIRREDGILEVTLHTNGDSLVWTEVVHRELPYLFADIGADPHNRVVILTGAGDDFCTKIDLSGSKGTQEPAGWDKVVWEGKRMLQNLLDIEVPVIGVFNGPASMHPDIPALSDIVLAADHTVVSDMHFPGIGLVPGDGAHLLWPLLLGANRGRYFLLTGQKLSAQELLDHGVVAEVHPRERVLERAWELARQLSEKPLLTLRYTRVAFVQQLKELMLHGVGYGLVLEGSARKPADQIWGLHLPDPSRPTED
jgi:enoyl-CoA hydratase/carnithine racemase